MLEDKIEVAGYSSLVLANTKNAIPDKQDWLRTSGNQLPGTPNYSFGIGVLLGDGEPGYARVGMSLR
ncbi:hypothetical protein Rvan_0026 [Rhodomicrobium vannielii ATCC 17100]|uniref:Uncharacterized protein n=1 Tax=Rhodomicrobium vannielii (strain ATCC 17100 / DSM 162 / LMG 4299 / NCIMB 10020 / ATH 3.1.1) TaxID=648757 RepID=E3I497_RHOVT|nr:hypothetical protein Rvan_0026 [Rhodomicrobium vannielii ATCC 17100]